MGGLVPSGSVTSTFCTVWSSPLHWPIKCYTVTFFLKKNQVSPCWGRVSLTLTEFTSYWVGMLKLGEATFLTFLAAELTGSSSGAGAVAVASDRNGKLPNL
jgi:hypothetical protein